MKHIITISPVSVDNSITRYYKSKYKMIININIYNVYLQIARINLEKISYENNKT